MKYAVITFGCRVNQADSLGFEQGFLAGGASAVPPEQADVVVVNTCSVTSSADQGARQTIRRIARANPRARIVVTGCYATRRPDELAALPNVVRVVPNDDKPHLIRIGIRGSGVGTRNADGSDSDSRRPPSDSATETEAAALPSRPASRDAQPSHCGCRPAARSRVLTASSRRQEASRGAYRSNTSSWTWIVSWPPASRKSPSPGCTLAPTDATSDPRRLSWTFCARSRRPMCSFASARSNRWTARQTSSIWSRAPRISRPTFICRCNTPAIACSRPCGGRTRSRSTLGLWRRFARGCLTRRSAQMSSWDFPVSPTRTSSGSRPTSNARRSRTSMCFRTRTVQARRHRRWRTKYPGPVIRERGRLVRAISERLAARFRDSQLGTVHSALTIEDGSLVVTGNYLKLRIAGGLPRNEWVRVRVVSHDRGELLSGGSTVGLDNQLSAGCPDVAAAALSD